MPWTDAFILRAETALLATGARTEAGYTRMLHLRPPPTVRAPERQGVRASGDGVLRPDQVDVAQQVACQDVVAQPGRFGFQLQQFMVGH